MFVDLNMPILDGMKLIKKVRESEASTGAPRVRICVVTTESAQATEDQARAMAERCGFEMRYNHGAGEQYYWLWFFKNVV